MHTISLMKYYVKCKKKMDVRLPAVHDIVCHNIETCLKNVKKRIKMEVLLTTNYTNVSIGRASDFVIQGL